MFWGTDYIKHLHRTVKFPAELNWATRILFFPSLKAFWKWDRFIGEKPKESTFAHFTWFPFPLRCSPKSWRFEWDVTETRLSLHLLTAALLRPMALSAHQVNKLPGCTLCFLPCPSIVVTFPVRLFTHFPSSLLWQQDWSILTPDYHKTLFPLLSHPSPHLSNDPRSILTLP